MSGFIRAAAIAAAAMSVISIPVIVNGGRPTAPRPALPPTACPSGTPLASGSIATVAGTGAAGIVHAGQRATLADLTPTAVAVAPDGTLAITVSSTYDVWRIGADGLLSKTLDPSATADFIGPWGLASDLAGDLYIAAGSMKTGRLWKLTPSGTLAVVAGTGTRGSTGNDGPATEAEVNPGGVAIGSRGDLYIDDLNNFRRVDSAGMIHAFAGSTTPGFAGDGGPATAATFGQGAQGVAVGPDGSVYLGDPGNHRIRKVDPTGVVTTIAGTGTAGYAGDGGPAVMAQLDDPLALAVDDLGNLFVADAARHVVRMIDAAGTITTVAGTGAQGYSGDCDIATRAQLDGPSALAVTNGALYIVDMGNDRLRVVKR